MLTQPVEQRRRRWRAWMWPALAVLAAVLVVQVPMWINDIKLNGLIARVEEYPLPPGTSHNAVITGKVGLQVGNSNHCDYLVRLSLHTSLPEGAVVKYYQTTTISGIQGGTLQGQVYFASGKGTRGVIVEFLEMHDAGLDLRCR